MARGRSTADLATLQMALVGYQLEKQKIEDKVREIQAQLKGKHALPAASGENAAAAPKRVLSPAARKRIAAAQRKRWAEHRKRMAAQAKQS
jgi:hypothetical protein